MALNYEIGRLAKNVTLILGISASLIAQAMDNKAGASGQADNGSSLENKRDETGSIDKLGGLKFTYHKCWKLEQIRTGASSSGARCPP